MLPSVDVFEDELLSLLSEDIKSDKSIYIEERRLKVSVSYSEFCVIIH